MGVVFWFIGFSVLSFSGAQKSFNELVGYDQNLEILFAIAPVVLGIATGFLYFHLTSHKRSAQPSTGASEGASALKPHLAAKYGMWLLIAYEVLALGYLIYFSLRTSSGATGFEAFGAGIVIALFGFLYLAIPLFVYLLLHVFILRQVRAGKVASFSIALIIVAISATTPWVLQHFWSNSAATQEKVATQVGFLPTVEPSLLLYYMQHHQFPSSLDMLADKNRGYQEFDYHGVNYDFELPLDLSTVHYILSSDGQQFLLWTKLNESKERATTDANDLLGPNPEAAASGMILGVDCSDPTIYCLTDTAQELLKRDDTQVFQSHGYDIYITRWHGTPILDPKIFIIRHDIEEAEASDFVIQTDDGHLWDASNICYYWNADPYCTKEHVISLDDTNGPGASDYYRKAGTYPIIIYEVDGSHKTILATSTIVVEGGGIILPQ